VPPPPPVAAWGVAAAMARGLRCSAGRAAAVRAPAAAPKLGASSHSRGVLAVLDAGEARGAFGMSSFMLLAM